MRITIVDLDWYNKQSFVPNIKCMKLSSYHIQLGDIVTLAQEELDLTYQHDIMYVVREKMMGTVPKKINLRSEKVKLIGPAFKFYTNYSPDITPVQAACRPDYTLYPIQENNRMSGADMVQFYSGNKRLELIQNFKNANRKSHYTYIIDEGFWEKKIEDIRACVDLLKTSKNVAFKEPISIKKILQRPEVEEIFFSLHYDYNTPLPLVNDCDWEWNDRVLDFLIKFHETYPTRTQTKVKFPTTSQKHKDAEDAMADFRKCMELINRAKEHKVHIVLQGPDRGDSPFWFYFEELESWTRYHTYKSFVEHMCHSSARQHNLPIDSLLWDKTKWSKPQIEMLMDLVNFHPQLIKEYGFRRWGRSMYHHVNFERILEKHLIC